MGNTDAAIPPELEPASLDEVMPRALAALAASLTVPEAARRRAVEAAEAMLRRELCDELPPPSGRRKTPSHPCTVPPDSA